MTGRDFLDLIGRRQSVRGYRARPVEREKLDRCIEAVRLSPSACNSQPWSVIVVDDPALRTRLADLTADRWLPLNHWTKQAPVHVVIVMETPNLSARVGSRLKDRDFSWIDLGIAAEHFCLQAAAEGLGTCMLGWFKEDQVKEMLSIPPRKRVGLIITLGYASEDCVRPKVRKATRDLVRWNRYR